MYIKHMKLVCSPEKQDVSGAAFLDTGPLQLLGPKEALFRMLREYQWPLGLSDHSKLFRTYQSIRERVYGHDYYPCRSCEQKVICLVQCRTDRNFSWPKETCPHLEVECKAIPDKRLVGDKVKENKLGFILEAKCYLCAYRTCCHRYPMIVRMLCPRFTKIEALVGKAEKRIIETWGSVDRFMAGLSVGWHEITWRPPEGNRKRRYRVALVYPDHEVELLKDYYPYIYRETPLPAYRVGLDVPEKTTAVYSKDDVLTSWVLWRMMQMNLIHTRKWKRSGPGYFYISGHSNFLLSLYVDTSGHPVLVSSTSKWKYNTVFADFNDIGWNLAWSANQVNGYL